LTRIGVLALGRIWCGISMRWRVEPETFSTYSLHESVHAPLHLWRMVSCRCSSTEEMHVRNLRNSQSNHRMETRRDLQNNRSIYSWLVAGLDTFWRQIVSFPAVCVNIYLLL
jgi:hypothetical protein